MSDLVARIRSEAILAGRPGQMDRLVSIAEDVGHLAASMAKVAALIDAAESGEGAGIVMSPGFSTYYAVETGLLRAALAHPTAQRETNGGAGAPGCTCGHDALAHADRVAKCVANVGEPLRPKTCACEVFETNGGGGRG